MKPSISIIAAMARNHVIGRNNRLPWHLPADLQHFKATTIGKPMVMGRRTWESLPGLLPQRTHIVITRDRDFTAAGAIVVHSLEEAISAAGNNDEIMIVGGANLYEQTLSIADKLYLTVIDIEAEGDACFPIFDLADWHEESRESHNADEKNRYDYSFITYRRVADKPG